MRITCILPAMLIVITIVSCKKEIARISEKPEVISEIKPGVIAEATENEFDSCNCAAFADKAGNGEYIKADLNGVPICFDKVPAFNDTFPNMMQHGFILRDTGNQYYDNLYMIRNASNSHWQAALFFENTYALTKTYPYKLPRLNSEICEIGELQINNLDHYTSCTFCPENRFNYYAPFWQNGVALTATSFKNNIFEGIFSGTITTGSGKRVVVTNGKFRIKLVVYRLDIKVN